MGGKLKSLDILAARHGQEMGGKDVRSCPRAQMRDKPVSTET